MNKRVFYLGFYGDDQDIKINRTVSLAAISKMDYIIDSLVLLGENVYVISPAWGGERKWKWYSAKEEILKENVLLFLSPSFSSPYKAFNKVSQALSLCWLYLTFLRIVRKGDMVVVYHSVFYSKLLSFLKRLKRVKIILEVEEVYTNIYRSRRNSKSKESTLFSTADSFIFSNYLLPELIGCKKEFITVHGNYYIPPIATSFKRDNQKINIVFSGMIENMKRGAYAAAKCAEFLGEKYIVNILGYGSDENISILKRLINEVNHKVGYTACFFHGTYDTQKYSAFLFDCDIALNPQEQNDMKTQYEFPSKVLSYLTHNLRVISTKLNCILNSDVSDLIYFIEDNSPITIAEKIKSIDLSTEYNSINRIKELDVKFKRSLSKLIEG